MSEPLVSIPLSLAIDLHYDCLEMADKRKGCRDEVAYLEQAETLANAIAKAKREAAIDQLSAIDQDRYKDTVNPLVRPSNE